MAATLQIAPASSPIDVDGSLGEAAWEDATVLSTWFETNPGDNLAARVENLGFLTYDDGFLYAGFRFADPDPARIRAPLADRDNVPSYTDYGGIILDATNDGSTAQMFLVNPRGIQYDAISSDVSGEDSSPDFHWEAAARVTEDGWELEMRIPFSSLRYEDAEAPAWRVMAYRNWPREFRYQMFSVPLPRDVSCFVCNAEELVGFERLPSGGSLVVAPYVAGTVRQSATDGPGSALETDDPDGDPGLDLKWTPNARTVLDATVNPDFSQIESDVPQIAANERFALFFPEKRPFFLEGIDLFSTPLQAVYTRSFTSPRWGARATGQAGSKGEYTVLVGEDRAGGSSILPGPTGSDFADRDFDSAVFAGRYRHLLGRSFWSVLGTAREIDGGGHNRVVGPDFQWRPNDIDWITGQFLWSDSTTPDRPDLADEWDGRSLRGHAAELTWWRGTGVWDFYYLGRDVHEDFRADNGFIPQVGYRRSRGEVGRTFRFEEGFVHRLRTYFISDYQEDREGRLLSREISPGFGLSGRKDSFLRMRLVFDAQRVGERVLDRDRLFVTAYITPHRRVPRLEIDAELGDAIDFANEREGEGGTVRLTAVAQPIDRFELRLNADRRWIDVDPDGAGDRRLLTASVARLRATWNFSARSWLRLIGEWIATERDPTLWESEVDPESEDLGLSAVFAWKLNWQTVVFAGVGNERSLDDFGNLSETGRQAFVKVSYAFQR